MTEELTTEEVENMIEKSKDRIVVRVPVMGANDLAVDKAIGFLRSIESSNQEDMDVIIFSKNSPTHQRVKHSAAKESLSKICERLVYRLHLDYLAYTELIVSIPSSGKNKDLVDRMKLRYGL